jgi:acyl-CoA thioester hydrolase
MRVRIYYHHTDCGGVVYYANYLNFFEEARTDYFARLGCSIKELSDSGTMFVVARQEIDYKAPAFYGDELEIKTKVAQMTGVKIIFVHETLNQSGALLNMARTVLVCVEKNLKPKAIPDSVRSKFSQ